jgi:hypothetical protein
MGHFTPELLAWVFLDSFHLQTPLTLSTLKQENEDLDSWCFLSFPVFFSLLFGGVERQWVSGEREKLLLKEAKILHFLLPQISFGAKCLIKTALFSFEIKN